MVATAHGILGTFFGSEGTVARRCGCRFDHNRAFFLLGYPLYQAKSIKSDKVTKVIDGSFGVYRCIDIVKTLFCWWENVRCVKFVSKKPLQILMSLRIVVQETEGT